MSSYWSTISLLSAVALAAAGVASAAQATREEGGETTRQLWDSALLARRAQAQAKKPASSEVQRLAQTLVGITVWRLRRARPEDDGTARVSIRGPAGVEEWTPERITAGTPLAEGDHIRVAIESARDGFLYVIDRDESAGGALGPPILIFPSLRTSNGRNAVAAGRPVEIPAWNDHPSYFTLRRSRPDQVSEVITVLITPQPLPDVSPASEPLRLDPERVALWQKTWGARVTRLEASGTKPAYGKSERDAALGLRALTLEDPLPQTMYRVETTERSPLLVNLSFGLGR